MKNFPVALKAELINPATWVAWVMTSLIVGISGPFDSFATVEFPTRLWGWALLIGLGLLGGVVLRTFVRTALEITDFLRCSFMTATMVSALLSAPLLELAKYLFSEYIKQSPSILQVMVFAFVISFMVASLRHSIHIGVATLRPEGEPDAPQPEFPRIVQRLEPRLQGRLIAMTVRNHYVDVYTSAGRGAVLMRFADAILEAEGEAGAQIHRSHWVAWWAVKAVERDGGRLFLRMCPELRLPVSKTHVGKLEEGGLTESEAA